ncbi:RAD55 family ATPase [Tardiphaga sp. 768_D3_N2_1]|uniref:RAD55 family ATPase n=1 Tax=Tardiphaga sp. 768_D3_N2_1 TaxID=3240783 RepID=UPI003F888454
MSGDSGRFATGVSGLDAILGGGVFDGGIYIIQGAPGAGKTILGNQICFAQAAQGRNALYITLLAESHARMIGHMRRMTFFDEAAIPDRMSYVGAFKTLEDDGLRGLLEVVRREVRTRKASILVLDGLITVHEKARSELELKKFIHELQTQAAFSNCTMFLLTSAFDADAHPPEHTMVDGLIELQTSLHGRRAERSLQVHKLRGSWFMGGKHSYRITDGGHGIYPRIEALLETPSVWDSADGPMVSVGIAGVDKMLGGGVDTHSVTVVLGPSGSGKTTAGLQFLTGGAADEKAMLFGFHENPMALRIKADSLKLPLKAREGKISLLWRPQTEAVLDEVATELLTAIRQNGVRRLVIDGIEGFSKLTDEKERIGSFLSALCNELRALGVATLATAETDQAGMTPGQPLKGVNQTGLSAVAENIIALHLAALRSENHRLMTILKSRDRRTDMRMRRFEILDGGIVLDADHQSAERILRDISNQGPAPTPSTDLKLTGE